VIEGGVGSFCSKIYARELPERSGETSISFRVAWV
jgi:hypothetical protein